MSSISFDNIYMLIIAIPLAILLCVPFFIAIRKENANKHNIASGIIHLLLAIIIAFAAAGTTIETSVTETDVYVLADLSYSSSRNYDLIDEYIEELKDNLPRNSKLGVVCFAGEQQLLVPLGKNLKSVQGVDTDLINDSETDIESALDYASTLFRDNVIKRVVVITDGKQTHVSDSNALKRAVDSLRAEEIYVDAVFLDNNITDDSNEVQLVSADVTNNTYSGKSETATISVRSTFNTNASITLSKNGVIIATRAITLAKGYNNVDFYLSTSEQGTFDYEVRIEAEGDENQNNNVLNFTQSVSEKINVLLITESDVDSIEFERLYRNKGNVTVYDPSVKLPCSIAELCKYDEIILSNADITKSSDYRMFMDNLDTAVSLFGKSFLVYGNNHIHEKEELKPLADMLPIRYGNVDRDAKLYTIVIDASRSLESASRFALAKSAAKQLVDTLNEGDNVCVVAFNGNYHTVFSPDAISDTPAAGESLSTREKVCRAIDSVGAEHGTVISFGLEQALALIKELPFGQKQIMLISDGLTVTGGSATGDESQRIDNVLAEMAKNRIQVSVIDVGRLGDESITAQNAEALLKNITVKTSGKYFYASTEAMLRDVMFGEGLLDDMNDIVIDEEAFVTTLKPSDPSMVGVDFTSEDYITGFIYNKAKSGSIIPLGVKYEGAKDSYVPLYSYWSYGNGRVSAFASSYEDTYAWDYINIESFFTNVLTSNIPDEKVDYPFLVELLEEDGYLKVNVTPAKIDPLATAKISVTYPSTDDELVTVENNMTFASSIYTYKIATYDIGKYSIKIDYVSEGSDSYTAEFGYNISYLPEYDSFAVYDVSVVYKMIGSDGKVMKGDDNIKVENEEGTVGTYVVNLMMPLLIVAVVLYVIDIIIRKLKWEDILSLFGKRKK